ncbi:tyrosine-type recombinase/integrase [Pseudoalteromonas piscicida]
MQSINQLSQQFISLCKDKRKLSDHTLKAYQIDLKQFMQALDENKSIEDISKVDLSQFHQFLVDSQLSNTSIKRKMACVRAMFQWLEREEFIEFNPFHKFQLDIKLPKRLPRNVPHSDLKRLLKQARKNCKSLWIESSNTYSVSQKRMLNEFTSLIALELMISTGIRVSELAGICLTDIYINEKKIKILGKGARERFVYLTDQEIAKLLKNYIESRAICAPHCDHLLINSRGEPASTQFLRKLIKKLSQQAYTQLKVTPHMLRHSAACELLESGLDIRFVQRLLGHSSISTTEIYTHVTDNALQKKITKANVRKRIAS